MKLPSLSYDKKRQLARSIFKLGLKEVKLLAKQHSNDFAKKLNINEELAEIIVNDAKKHIDITKD